MKIIICGGHLTPALSVINKLKIENHELWGKDQVLFVGRKYPLEGETTVSAEQKIIAQMGIPFIPLTTGRLQRKFTRYTIPSLLKIPIGFFQALWWTKKFKPDIILSFGGYVALPVVVAGWFLRVPIVTHEQTVVSGLANKIIGMLAKKICVSWPGSVKNFPASKVILTGNPVRREIFEIKKTPLLPVSHALYPMIYVTGGSLGSHWINEAVLQCLPQLLEKYVVVHQCGESEKYRDWEKLKAQSASWRTKLKRELKERYFLTKYVEPEDIGWVLNRADLVVSRAGANILAELAALGKPALFIPIPWASGDEQTKNAQMLADVGIAEILPQRELDGKRLFAEISKMIKNLKKYQKNAELAKRLIDLEAAAKIVKVVKEIYAQRRKD